MVVIVLNCKSVDHRFNLNLDSLIVINLYNGVIKDKQVSL